MTIADHTPKTNRSTRWISELSSGTPVKAFLAQPRLIFNLLLFFVFCVTWIRDVRYWFHKDAYGTSLNYWAYTDWLIDYSQGFIRRGLSGEIWRLVPNTVTPLAFVAAFSWVLILAVVFGYVRLLGRSWKTFHPLILFGLLFLPSLFFFYIHDHNAIARKEILGYVTVLLHLLAVEKSFSLGNGVALPAGNLRRYMGWLMPIVLILLPALILIHEGSFLLFVPLHGMITLTVLRMNGSRRFMQAALWTGLLYLPAVFVFCTVYLSGTPSYSMLVGICEKWLPVGAIREGSCNLPPGKLPGSTLPGSFIPMTWSLRVAASITWFFISSDWIAWVLILPTLGVSLWYLVRQAIYSILRACLPKDFSPKAARRYTGLFFRKYFLIPLLLALPTYFTAYDYGRWFTVTCINFAMLAVSVNLPCWEFALWKKTANEEATVTHARERLDHPLVFYVVSIIIFILAVVLLLPHYCLFSCNIVRSPLEFFSHTFTAR